MAATPLRSLRTCGYGPFADEEPESGDGDEARQQRPKKNFAERMAGDFEEPERGERPSDGTNRVHQAFEAKRAAVGVWRNVGGEQGFLRG